MDLILEFIKYKKNLLKKYIKILISEEDILIKTEYYVNIYLDTYISSYYYGVLQTLDNINFEKIGYNEVIEEIKGKNYELIYELKLNQKDDVDSNTEEIINKSMLISLLAILLDLEDFSNCSKLVEYTRVVKKFLSRNFKTTIYAEDTIIELAKTIKNSHNSINKYILETNSTIFNLVMNNYINCDNYYKVDMKFNIKHIENNYKKIVIDKVFNSKEIFLEKIQQQINLLNNYILKKIIAKKEIPYFFIRFKLKYFSSNYSFDKIMRMIDNPLTKRHIIFIVSDKEYEGNKILLRKFNSYNFAIAVDFKNIRNYEKKISYINSLSIFKYLLVSNQNDENTNYIMNYGYDNIKPILNLYEGEDKEV